MSTNDPGINYHNALEQISSENDPVIKKLQRLNRRTDVEDSIFKHLITLPLKDMKNLLKVFKGIKNINLSAIPLIGTGIAAFLTGKFISWPVYLQVLFVVGVFIVLLAALLPIYFSKMLQFNESVFHLGAYKKFRKQEYDLISYAVENDISYKGIYDYVTGVITKQENTSQTIEIVTRQYNQDKAEIKEELKEELKEVKQKFAERISRLKTAVNELREEGTQTDIILRYLIALQADINVILYRIANNVFSISDLRFISGFTIYEQEGNDLIKICDEGTTGSSPNIIKLDDSKYEDWAAVIVAKYKLKEPKTNQPRKNYNIVSYRMNMDKDGEKVWIMNFHLYQNIHQKAWYLLRNSDIINNEEIYRLFHALSLILNKQMGGVASYVDSADGEEGSK